MFQKPTSIRVTYLNSYSTFQAAHLKTSHQLDKKCTETGNKFLVNFMVVVTCNSKKASSPQVNTNTI